MLTRAKIWENDKTQRREFCLRRKKIFKLLDEEYNLLCFNYHFKTNIDLSSIKFSFTYKVIYSSVLLRFVILIWQIENDFNEYKD